MDTNAQSTIGGRNFRKKPVVIQAIQFDGLNGPRIETWSDGKVKDAPLTRGDPTDRFHDPRTMTIETLEGTMTANAMDWIIRGVKGEYYPCKPDIFDATYEAAPFASPEC